jgi:hypothetical protein
MLARPEKFARGDMGRADVEGRSARDSVNDFVRVTCLKCRVNYVPEKRLVEQGSVCGHEDPHSRMRRIESNRHTRKELPQPRANERGQDFVCPLAELERDIVPQAGFTVS